jgi:hypothetical protein
MQILLLILAVLLIFWLLGRGFISADPKRLAALLPWLGAAAGGALLVFLAVTGKLYAVLGFLPLLLPVLMRWKSLFNRTRTARGPTPGRQSAIETPYLRMRLDHDTGGLEGEIRQGRFRGRSLGDLAQDELLDLLEECRTADRQGAQLLETWLDRTRADWRTAAAPPPSVPSAAMTEREAWEVLGLPPGADEKQIREAHRRLMVKNHPDQGGSTYLAAKINQAKDLLLANKAKRA